MSPYLAISAVSCPVLPPWALLSTHVADLCPSRELLKTAHEYGKLCSLAIDEVRVQPVHTHLF